MSRGVDVLKESKKIRRRRRLIKLGSVFFVLLVLAGGGLIILHQDKFLITNVQISGLKKVDKTAVLAAVGGVLTDERFSFLPRQSSFFYPREFLTRALELRFLRLASVDLRLGDLNTLNIIATERKPQALWCRQGETLENCFYLDQTGLAFLPAPDFSHWTVLYFTGGEINPTLGERPLGEREFERLAEFTQEITRQLSGTVFEGQTVAGVGLEPGGDYQLILHHAKLLPRPWSLLINRSYDYTELARNFQAAIRSEEFRREVMTSPAELAYVDLRFDDKVFYKFQE